MRFSVEEWAASIYRCGVSPGSLPFDDKPIAFGPRERNLSLHYCTTVTFAERATSQPEKIKRCICLKYRSLLFLAPVLDNL